MIHKNIPYRRMKAKKQKAKLQFLAERLSYWPSGAYKVEKDGKSWYKRYYRGSHSAYLKKQASKANRRYEKQLIKNEDHISSKSHYKRVFDYWWELY